mgnify:CR=1 FL=1
MKHWGIQLVQENTDYNTRNYNTASNQEECKLLKKEKIFVVFSLQRYLFGIPVLMN